MCIRDRRYALLCASQTLISYGLVFALSQLLSGGPGTDSLIKIVVDVTLFFISFRIQRDWVFADAKKRGKSPDAAA